MEPSLSHGRQLAELGPVVSRIVDFCVVNISSLAENEKSVKSHNLCNL